jgi:hypothetical protein
LAVLGWAGGSEEVDQQLCDALGLVVMDPMRGVRQALDAVEVGHVVAVRLGELGAEVAIALSPDDQAQSRAVGARMCSCR